jgi:hypothetical protein
MEEVARQIDPTRTAKELLEEAKADHPTAEGLLDAYRQAMADIRQYVIDRDIATIPPGESLRVVETPVFMRPIIPYAAYMPPGILEARQEGIFVVTPVDPDAPPEEQEQKLKGHHWAKLPLTALHEAYPGHHLQLVYSNLQPTIPRRMGSFLATLFIEGWAFYCAGGRGLKFGIIGHEKGGSGPGPPVRPVVAGGAHHPGRVAAHPGDGGGRGGRFLGEGAPTGAGQRPGRSAPLHAVADPAPIVPDGQAGHPGADRRLSARCTTPS